LPYGFKACQQSAAPAQRIVTTFDRVIADLMSGSGQIVLKLLVCCQNQPFASSRFQVEAARGGLQ